MRFIKDLSKVTIKEETAITLGKFDGLHRGHQKLVKEVIQKKEEGCLSVVFTFDRPPQRLLSGSKNKIILTNEERQQLLGKMQLDIMIQCPFTKEIAKIEPEDFIRKVLKEKLNAKYIIVGTDFHFGHERRGDISLLDKLSKIYNYKLIVLEKEKYRGKVISSTYIKELITNGQVKAAAKLLGYPYFLSGSIVKGKQLGRTIGVPTANLIPDNLKILPRNGVYTSRFWIEGIAYDGMTNIGLRPTVENTIEKNVETYLFNFQEEIYGKRAIVEILEYEREEQKFESLEKLKEQLDLDKKQTQKILEQYRETEDRFSEKKQIWFCETY